LRCLPKNTSKGEAFGTIEAAAVYLISREEGYPNIEKFGYEYKRYRETVPRMNIIIGIIRMLRRRKRE